MKQTLILAAVALACTATFAQAPPGVLARPSQETNPTLSGGAPAAKAEAKVDAKKGAMPMASGGTMPMAGATMPMAAGGAMGGTSMMGMNGMDANGDGMISKKEWDRHHSRMWSRMKSKNGMMPMADVEAMMKGGPN